MGRHFEAREISKTRVLSTIQLTSTIIWLKKEWFSSYAMLLSVWPAEQQMFDFLYFAARCSKTLGRVVDDIATFISPIAPQKTKMILTTCAACAAPLAHNAPRCVRCWTRYCDSTCWHQHDHAVGARMGVLEDL